MENMDLSVITGINVSKVTEYFDGDVTVLNEILGVALDDGTNKLERLKNAFEEKNWHNYEIEVHSIKSSAAILCVEALSEHARLHEIAAKDHNIDYIISDSANLVADFEKFLSEIKLYLGR